MLSSSNDEKIDLVIKQENGKAVLEVHHFYHTNPSDCVEEEEGTKTAATLEKKCAAVTVTQPKETKSSFEEGAFVRFCCLPSGVNSGGSVGGFLGVQEDGSVVPNMPDTDDATRFKVHKKGEHFFFESVTRPKKCLRVTAKGDVNCGGGMGGRWTLFALEKLKDTVAIMSVANAGKSNQQGTDNWFLSMDSGKVTGKGSKQFLKVQFVESRQAAKQGTTKDDRIKLRQERQAAKQEMRKVKQAATVVAKDKSEQELSPQVECSKITSKGQVVLTLKPGNGPPKSLPSPSTLLGLKELADSSDLSALAKGVIKSGIVQVDTNVVCNHCKTKIMNTRFTSTTTDSFSLCAKCYRSEIGTKLNTEHKFQRVPPLKALKQTILSGAVEVSLNHPDPRKKDPNVFPTEGKVLISPAAFVDAQNRKGTVGWNIGCAPNGILVADASSGTWGQWQAIKGANGSVILEASHTPEFHLAIRKDMQLTHKGGKGRFAQFIVTPKGKTWSFRCAGHTENETFLAVNSSGILYVATQQSKDTKFYVKKVAE